MNCPCDEFVFPPPLVIPAGLGALPRQLATFPEFRTAMLAAVGLAPALRDWRARSSDDFGVMLLEMWAYVCDDIAFYDEVIASEAYVRTAQLRASLRKLVALLGYQPRPAVASRAHLAVLAEGRQPVLLPPGTAFRSGAFPGGSPQVFELDAATQVHPFTNGWTVARTRPAVFEAGASVTTSRTILLIEPKSARIKVDQLVLIEDVGNAARTRPRMVKGVDDFAAKDGLTYKRVTLSSAVPLPSSTPVANVRLSTPSQIAKIWPYESPEGNNTGLIEYGITVVYLDAVYRDIVSGTKVVFEKQNDLRWFTVTRVVQTFANLPALGDTTIKDASNNTVTVTPPPARVPVTYVELDVKHNDPSRREGVTSAWTDADVPDIRVHFDFRPAGTPTVPNTLRLEPGDPIVLEPLPETPPGSASPDRFLLEDHNATGAELTASLSFAAGTLTPSPPLAQGLVAPVTAYGNVVAASRGESVQGEVLGSGDASLANQAFTLKKSPLTYLPAPTGVVSTLRVRVDGVLWTEVPSFFGVKPDAAVYVVRQNDAGESHVIFGDGVRGQRLPSGVANVVASYRFGAGKASPPAGSIHQLAKPVKGIATVRNPVAAFGGDDAEPATGLRTYAPRSALLLGRAISLADMEAGAASVGGVRAVRAEWQWSVLRQRPVVQIWYVGAASLDADITKKLRGLSDPSTPIQVDQAIAVPGSLAIAIEVDPARVEKVVLADVRAALMDPETGLLAPERIGIGVPLFRSRIFETVLAVPGALAVTALLWNGSAFDPWGIQPGTGKYFDLETGSLLLNGKATDG